MWANFPFLQLRGPTGERAGRQLRQGFAKDGQTAGAVRNSYAFRRHAPRLTVVASCICDFHTPAILGSYHSRVVPLNAYSSRLRHKVASSCSSLPPCHAWPFPLDLRTDSRIPSSQLVIIIDLSILSARWHFPGPRPRCLRHNTILV